MKLSIVDAVTIVCGCRLHIQYEVITAPISTHEYQIFSSDFTSPSRMCDTGFRPHKVINQSSQFQPRRPLIPSSDLIEIYADVCVKPGAARVTVYSRLSSHQSNR